MSERKNVQAIYPLAPAQRGMLYYCALHPEDRATYFEQWRGTYGGALDPGMLRRAWELVVARHPVLRTQFLWERREHPLQVVRSTVEVPWREEDWRTLPGAERERRLTAYLEEDRRRGFALDRAPLTRLALFRLTDNRWRLVWSFHHLVLDGWSIAVVLREVHTVYAALAEGVEPELPPVRPYKDFISWLGCRDEATDREFWARELGAVERPFRTPWPAASAAADERAADGRHGEHRRTLPASEARELSDAARAHGLTLNALAQGAFALLLQRYSGATPVTYGTVSSGRPPELTGVEQVAGVFMNALPFRVEVPERAPVGEWLRGVQLHQVEAREHAHCALEDVQRWAGLPTGEPLFDALMIFENYPAMVASDDPGESGGVELLDNVLDEEGVFPFSLYVSPRGDRVDLAVAYDRARFDAGGMERALGHYVRLLRGLAAALADGGSRRLGEIPMLADGEGRPLTGARGDEAGLRPVHEQVAERARKAPDAVAVATRDGALCYGALDARSDALAHALRQAGAGPGSIVALALRRSPEVPLSMLAVLKAGAAYLPLDPAYPAERASLMLADAGVELVVTSAATLDEMGEMGDLPFGDRTVVVADAASPTGAASGGEGRAAGDGSPPAVDPRQAAYVIYTSGSTGAPKGVVVEHQNLARYVETAAAEQEVGPGTRVLQLASVSFDTSAEEIWPCLARGGTLVLRDEEAAGSALGFSRYVEEQRVEVVDLPTAFWHELATQYAAGDAVLPDSLRLVIIGGERALGERLADWRRAVASAGLGDRVRLLNTYGPTETTIVTASVRLDGGASEERRTPLADPPIGHPVPGSRIALVDPAGRLVPPGAEGEAWVGGGQVTRGYLNRPATTAERFVPDPFSGLAGARLYRTGDLCAEVAGTGEERVLGFRGRIDAQVKVRGYRVEPGEIESALVAHPAVGEAAVVARSPGAGGDRDVRLVAYVAGRVGGADDEAPGEADLRAFLAERLPEFMVPARFVVLEALPKTTSGKLDRGALPEPDRLGPEAGAVYVAPRTPTEELLAGLWCELLGAERIGVHDDFFALGGHSLLVGRLAARLRSTLGVELPLLDIFEHPTVAELAAVVESADGTPREGLSPDRTPELPPLTATDRSGPLPLSYQQERVWFLQQLVPGSIAYNFQMRLFLRGELDVAALERALSEIVRRHEVLRTTFPEHDGRPVQVVQGPWTVELPVTDLSGLSDLTGGPEGLPAAERRAEEILAEEVAKPFELTSLPLIRWRLLRLDESHHQLIQVEHHFVHDGWSVAVLLRELKTLYEAFSADQPSPLPELPAQYGDFAVWQRGWMEGEAMERLLAYWTKELEGVPTRLDLPLDRPRPRRSTMQGDAIRELLPAGLYRRLRELGRREGFTLFMTMSTVFQALLCRYTGREDFLVGTGVANRRLAELEPIIGMMVNSLVLRADTSGDPTFRELLVRVRRSALGAHAHQDMPFERLVEELQPERDPSINPLFQVMFSFHDAAVPDLSFGGLEAGFLVEHNRSAKTDLNVIVAPRAEQRVGREASEVDDRAMVTWEFSTDLFDRATIERLIGHYLNLAEAALADPDRKVSELPLMGPAEEELVIREWSGWRTGYPRTASLVQLFAERVAASRDAPALRFEGRELTYGQLARRAARIAHCLRDLGVRRGMPVALCLERGLDLVPAILGILQAGGCYVPLDAGYPRERLAFMMADVAAPVLVTQESLLERLPTEGVEGSESPSVLCLDMQDVLEALEAAPTTAPELADGERPDGEDVAYVVYTSGSTGRPKGVVVPQRAVARLVLEADFAHFGPGETLLQLAPVSFDAATLEIWAPLLNGGRLVVHPPGPPSLEGLGRIVAEEGVTALWITTGLFHQMVEGNLDGFAPLSHVLTGGEVASTAHFRRMLEAHPELKLTNFYGPTENTTFTTHHPMRSAKEVTDPVSIGRPIADTEVFVVDARLDPVPVGVPGELVTGGDGLAQGYWGRPGLTAERFVPNPFSGSHGERLYRSGDLVRWRPGGELEFIGRFDTQVKVRGFRIETGEVEQALVAHPAVAEALVMVRGTGVDRVLVGYVVPGRSEGGDALDALEEGGVLREYLAERLPDHMVPSAFVALEAFPLDPNGKVDRRALPDPSFEAAQERYVAPRSDLERALVDIWTDLLPVERVGVRDDFFDLGGHSLAATRIASRIRRDVGVDVPLTLLFEEPTVEALARRLEVGSATAHVASEVDVAPDVAAGAEDLSDEELDALLGRMIAGENG